MSWEKGVNAMWLQQATKGENVYFISDGEFVKIGKTTGSPECRLASLQTGNPKKLVLLGIAYNGGGTDGAVLEHFIHNVCEQYRVRGEWFSLEAIEWLITYLKCKGEQVGSSMYSLGFEVCSFAGKPHFMFNENWEKITNMWDAKEKTKSQLVDEYIERQKVFIAEVNKHIDQIRQLRRSVQ